MAYGQECALFWAIVQSIKKLFAVRPIEQTRSHNHPPFLPQRHLPGGLLLSPRGCGREEVGWARDSGRLGNYELYWAGLHQRPNGSEDLLTCRHIKTISNICLISVPAVNVDRKKNLKPFEVRFFRKVLNIYYPNYSRKTLERLQFGHFRVHYTCHN